MSPFTFHAIQTLELGDGDNPNIDVQNGRLILTASRGGDQIMITAPLNSVVPTAVQTTVKRPAARRRRSVPAAHQNRIRGENHKLAKLTEAAVRTMRAKSTDPTFLAQHPTKYAVAQALAEMFGVHFTTVSKILDGKSWKHVQ